MRTSFSLEENSPLTSTTASVASVSLSLVASPSVSQPASPLANSPASVSLFGLDCFVSEPESFAPCDSVSPRDPRR